MATFNVKNIPPSVNKISCHNVTNNPIYNILNKTEDWRLMISSKIEQPTYLKLSRRIHLELLKLKKGKPKDHPLAGYNPLRGDFEIEYNNRAEFSVVLASELRNCSKDIENRDEHRLIDDLQAALVDQYTSQLKERDRRKSVIKRHGLMNQKGTGIWFSRLEATVGKTCAKKIIRLCPLTTPDEIELLSCSLGLMNAKRAEVNKLNFYRTQRGITSKWDMEIFEKERQKREMNEERIEIRHLAAPQPVKRKRACLDIFHLPRFKELLPKEADLCRSNSLKPSVYLDIKDVLITDCKKNDGLLLKRARKLVKIDVNKTRKIFDLMLEEGFIWAPAKGNAK